MRFLASIVLLLFLSQAFADCIGRYYVLGPDDEQPIFTLLSCRPAIEYVLENKYRFEDQIGYKHAKAQITSGDLAIMVRPINKSAVSIMYREEGEVWHYNGSCKELPLDKPVVLTTMEHCSDTGLTMHAFLSDMTIKGFSLQD